MSIIGSLNIAKSALNVNQLALNVVSNNVANMNTEGYLKQSVNLEELKGYTPYSSSSGIKIYTGGGVGISNISQNTNQALFDYLNGQNSTYADLNAQMSAINDLADILNELGDDALSTAMTEFYSAAQRLSTNPSDSVLRINYVNAAQTVAEKFNQLSSSITSNRTELVGDSNYPSSVTQSQAGRLTTSANSIISQLAELNSSILKTSIANTSTNDIINQQNQLLNELSSIVDFTTTTNSNGTLNLSIAGVDIILGSEQVAQLNITAGDADNPAKVQIQTLDDPPKVKVSDISGKLTGGELKGILTVTSNTSEGLTYQKVLDQINLLAKTFAESVNEIQTYNDGNTAAMAIGLDAEGNQILVPSTEPLFEIPANGEFNAANIKINQNLYDNPNLVAVARVEVDADGNPVDNRAIGDSNNLIEIISLQSKNFNELGGVTFSTNLKNLVTKVGLEAENLTNKAEAQANIVDQTSTKYYSEGGVNLDEELIDMIKYQRAYEAASRVVSACNEMLQVLVTLGQ